MLKILFSLPLVFCLLAIAAPAHAVYTDRHIGLYELPQNRVIYLPDTGVRSVQVPREDRCLGYDAYGKCNNEQRYYSPRTIRLRAYLHAEPTSINPYVNNKQGRCIIDYGSRGQVVNRVCFDR